MSGEKDIELAKQKAAAAAKAKAAALAKKKAVEQTEEETSPSDDLAKQKAAAAAKAKAAALAKKKATEQSQADSGSTDDVTKAKAAAAAKAKAAALAKKKATEQSQADSGSTDDAAKAKAVAAAKAKAAALAKAKAASSSDVDNDEKAKAIAAAKAKAAAVAKAKATAASGKVTELEAEEEKKPSVNQPYLDKYMRVIEEHLGQDVIEDHYINSLSKDVPTIVIKKEAYYKVAQFLKYNEQLQFDYLSELHGTDFETHMEVYVHLYSYINHQSLAIKVKIDRDQPVIDSLAPLWAGANWPECEAYDLLGIRFTGHPGLYRIMLGEDWIGHPLRKDYEPDDAEV